MLTTKRYEYLEFEKIQVHPTVGNHRQLDMPKVKHYQRDILENGLLEPLVIWEKSHGEYYLVGGFHRTEAIKQIRRDYPGYFDRVDVRIVSGNPDEIRALNLKLNADRVDTKITDYFETIIYLNNVNWDKERIANFMGKSTSWVEDILRYVPIMDPQVHKLLEVGKLSWNKTKDICRAVQNAPAGKEKEVLDRMLDKLISATPPTKKVPAQRPRKPITMRSACKRLGKTLEKTPEKRYTFSGEEMLSLFKVLDGKGYEEVDLERVRQSFPELFPRTRS